MKRSAILCLTTLLAAGAQAQTFNDTARVRNVNPQYENVSVPRNECTSQWVTEQQPVAASRNYGGLAVGGVAGAVLGNQVGKGHGREAATALGAVVGALAGEHFANQNGWGGGYQQAAQPQQRQVQTCNTVNDVQSRLTGYQVEYEYRGQVYSTVTRENPGRTLPVRVSVAPVEPVASVGRELQGAREYQGRRDDRGGREYYGAYNR
ncbi:glycine zipper 2TM domain-containing protein [Polaromonas sp. JS666]|uniref:glycine zipper 2TM domain-containing protein n=1 Tax=Polaromonas sp. (strain JS666 / ATCC BAA-500) TaxID=296591 RepID=UPI0000464571|nr:glycine zipper 2TM domain-containing protein [Polaromonas sp. JS666]ABE43885.1 17 kDa surface antigen [Polaromonas sp. JS666]